MTTTTDTAAAAFQLAIVAGRDYSTTSLREFHLNLFGQNLAYSTGYKTKAAAVRAGQKLAHQVVVAMVADTAEAREIVQRAAELNDLWNAKKFKTWQIKQAHLRALVDATFCTVAA